jgi:hypothetical protein
VTAEKSGAVGSSVAAERSSEESGPARSAFGDLPGVPKQSAFDLDDFGPEEPEPPLPDLPPLPADPRWRVEHLPFLTAASIALLLCAASIGFLNGGRVDAFGAAAGVAITTVSFTMSTLVIAWADTVRPALLMPLGLLAYVVKYTLLGVVLAYVISSGWPGRTAMGWGVVAGVLGWTSVQIWWVARIAARRSATINEK